MIVQRMPALTLKAPIKQKINFTSANAGQDIMSKSSDSFYNNVDGKKKAYREGLITGIVISILASATEQLIEYFVCKSSHRIK